MVILGYVGYAILIFFALTWTLGVRLKLGTGTPTIIGAVFFVASAVVLGVAGANKLHSWWLVPAGILSTFVVTMLLAARVPVITGLVRFVASTFALIVRVGIPAQRIRQAQMRDAAETIERVFSNREE